MDKAEYQSRLEELNSLVKKEDYEGALAVVEAVDWRRVKSLRTLGMVADVYEANKRYPEAKKILLMAYDRSSIGKGILYRLVEVSVKMKDFDEAIDFYNEFEAVARHDNSRYLLKYKILRGQKAPLEEQISLLEEYKEREFTERWAYELANLYSKAGETQKCIDACDELILWFSEGKYVTKAMDLKMKYEPLSPSQQIKYEHRFDYKKNEEPSEDPEALEVRLAGESGAGEMAATKEPAEAPEVKPVNGGVMSQYVAGEEEKEAGSPYEAYEKTQQAEADAEQVQEYEALQQTEEPIEEIPEEQAYADSTPTYLGNTIDLHAELAKSIRDVFSFRGKKQEETAVEEETSEEPVQYEVKDLEPEQLDVNVEVSPDANTTIKTRPQPKPKEKAEPVMPKAPKPEKKYEEPDLEALFQETAANLSEEVAEEEAEEPVEPAAEAETAEQPMDPESETEARETAEEPQAEAEPEEDAEPADEAVLLRSCLLPARVGIWDTLTFTSKLLPAPDLLLRTVPAFSSVLAAVLLDCLFLDRPSLPVSFRGRRRHRGCSLQALREDRSYFQGTSACCLHTPALPESPRSAPLSAAVLVLLHLLCICLDLLCFLICFVRRTGFFFFTYHILAFITPPFTGFTSGASAGSFVAAISPAPLFRLTALQVLPDPRRLFILFVVKTMLVFDSLGR